MYQTIWLRQTIHDLRQKAPIYCDKGPGITEQLPAALPAEQPQDKAKVRVLYELCCEYDSSLHRYNPCKDTCEVVRITKRDDLLDPSTIKHIEGQPKKD